MKILDRALLSIYRQKKMTLILFMIIFILGTVIISSFMIYTSSQKVEKEIKSRLGASGTISLNYELIEKDKENNSYSPDKEILTVDMIEDISKSPYIKKFEYNIYGIAETKNLNAVKLDTNNDTEKQNIVTFKGVNNHELIDIDNGIIELENGVLFEKNDIKDDSGKAIISKNLADSNNLNINDKITLDILIKSVLQTNESFNIKTYSVPIEIIGIFDITKSNIKNKNIDENQAALLEEQVNTMYFSNEFVKNYNKKTIAIFNELNPDFYINSDGTPMTEKQINELVTLGTPYYKLKNIDSVSYFTEEANAILQNSYFKVITTDNQYSLISGNIENLNKISINILLGTVLSSIIIINLVVILFMKQRKNEIAVLLALGAQKKKIMEQIIIEVLIISCISVSLSLVSSIILEKHISNSFVYSTDSLLLEDNVSNSEEEYLMSKISDESISQDDVQELYKETYKSIYYIFIVLVIILLILLSLIGSLLYILHLNPKKILLI